MSKDKPPKPFELRPFEEGGSLLDEVIAANPQMVHVECMSDECYWLGITCSDGTWLSVNFYLADETVTDEDGKTFRPIQLRVQEIVPLKG